jgi:hypothetical protein
MFFIWLTAGGGAQAGDSIAQAGDVLQFVLPATAAGLTLYNKDGKGALEFGESAALTLGITYGLKYTVNEKRPNGGKQSFPSAHTSFPSLPPSSCASVTVGNMAYRLTPLPLLSLTVVWRRENIIRMTWSLAQPLELSAVTSSPNHTKAGTFRPMPMVNILESGSVALGNTKVG